MYAIGYVRVSDKSQLQGGSLESQTRAIQKYAKEKNYILLEVVSEVYSGYYLSERKKLAEVRKKICNRSASVLVVNSLDRLARKPVHQAVLLNECDENGARLESVTEDLQQSALGDLLRNMLVFAAEIEREHILERSARGVANKIANGQMIGVGFPRYGYIWGDDKHTHYKEHPVQAAVVREVYKIYTTTNRSLRSIAEWLNQTHPKGDGVYWWGVSVSKMLKWEGYKGVAKAKTHMYIKGDKGQRVDVAHPDATTLPAGVIPALVSDEVWSKAQTRLANNKQESARNATVVSALLRAGFVSCGYCGNTIHVLSKQPTKANKLVNVTTQYACMVYGSEKSKLKKASMKTETLDTIVWAFVMDMLDNVEAIRYALESSAVQYTDIKLLKSMKQEIEQQQDLLVTDLRSVSGRTRELLLAEMQKLDTRLDEIEREISSNVPLEEQEKQRKIQVQAFLDWCSQERKKLEHASYEEKRTALRQLGIHVTLYQEHDPIHPRYRIDMMPEIMKKITFSVPTCTHVGTEKLVSLLPDGLLEWLTPLPPQSIQALA